MEIPFWSLTRNSDFVFLIQQKRKTSDQKLCSDFGVLLSCVCVRVFVHWFWICLNAYFTLTLLLYPDLQYYGSVYAFQMDGVVVAGLNFFPSTLYMRLEYIILCTNAVLVLHSMFHFGTKNHFQIFLALDQANADCESLKCIDCVLCALTKKHNKIFRSILQWPMN